MLHCQCGYEDHRCLTLHGNCFFASRLHPCVRQLCGCVVSGLAAEFPGWNVYVNLLVPRAAAMECVAASSGSSMLGNRLHRDECPLSFQCVDSGQSTTIPSVLQHRVDAARMARHRTHGASRDSLVSPSSRGGESYSVHLFHASASEAAVDVDMDGPLHVFPLGRVGVLSMDRVGTSVGKRDTLDSRSVQWLHNVACRVGESIVRTRVAAATGELRRVVALAAERPVTTQATGLRMAALKCALEGVRAVVMHSCVESAWAPSPTTPLHQITAQSDEATDWWLPSDDSGMPPGVAIADVEAVINEAETSGTLTRQGAVARGSQGWACVAGSVAGPQDLGASRAGGIFSARGSGVVPLDVSVVASVHTRAVANMILRAYAADVAAICAALQSCFADIVQLERRQRLLKQVESNILEQSRGRPRALLEEWEDGDQVAQTSSGTTVSASRLSGTAAGLLRALCDGVSTAFPEYDVYVCVLQPRAETAACVAASERSNMLGCSLARSSCEATFLCATTGCCLIYPSTEHASARCLIADDPRSLSASLREVALERQPQPHVFAPSSSPAGPYAVVPVDRVGTLGIDGLAGGCKCPTTAQVVWIARLARAVGAAIAEERVASAEKSIGDLYQPHLSCDEPNEHVLAQDCVNGVLYHAQNALVHSGCEAAWIPSGCCVAGSDSSSHAPYSRHSVDSASATNQPFHAPAPGMSTLPRNSQVQPLLFGQPAHIGAGASPLPHASAAAATSEVSVDVATEDWVSLVVPCDSGAMTCVGRSDACASWPTSRVVAVAIGSAMRVPTSYSELSAMMLRRWLQPDAVALRRLAQAAAPTIEHALREEAREEARRDALAKVIHSTGSVGCMLSSNGLRERVARSRRCVVG